MPDLIEKTGESIDVSHLVHLHEITAIHLIRTFKKSFEYAISVRAVD
ncbi:MAG: hypothetical protein ACXAEF_08815 [Candidatus Thorarchaeota archaeon]|jgi:hypothetical protein